MTKNSSKKILLVKLRNLQCNYSCPFCEKTLKKQESSNIKDGVLRLFHAAQLHYHSLSFTKAVNEQRIKAVHFVDGEPTMFPHIIPLVAAAKKAGFKEIILSSNGEKLADFSFVKKIVSAGVTGIRLPIYGKKQIHDAIVKRKDAFLNFMKAVSNLGILGIKPVFQTVVLKQNLSQINYLLSKYGDIDLHFPWPITDSFLDYSKACLKYKSYCPKLTKIPKHLFPKLRLNIPCIYNKIKPYFYKKVMLYQYDKGKFVLEKFSEVKSKPAKCRICQLFNKCSGIYPAYLTIYGDG